jgi:tetratricopeptide (TPR) repeat protein
MGRPEAPLDASAGPLAEFARRLRQLREDSGGRSYRQLARSANFAAPTLARAASGRSLPSWEVTRAYIAACGGDPGQWRSAWAVTAELLDRSHGCPGAAGQPELAAGNAALPVRQLPADLPDFIGRAAECERLSRLSDAPAPASVPGGAPLMVVISGPGGIGKSTLAVHVAHQLAEKFPDGQLFADLHGHDKQPAAPPLVAASFLAALGRPADPWADPVASFRSVAAGLRLLVLLDNAAAEEQVAPLLPGSARCLVIVTSRQVLGALASGRALRLDVLGLRDSVELLTRVAGPGQVTDTVATESLAELCGRFPLALRVAGSRLAAGPAGGAGWLAGRLRDEDHRLRQLATGDLELTAVFALSYRSLAGPARRAFRGAGLFPGPDFTPGAVALLADMSAVEAGCAVDRLVDASFVQPAGPGRYRMHDLVRLYARWRAEAESGTAQRAQAMRRLAAAYLAAVDTADREMMPTRGRPAPMEGEPTGSTEAAPGGACAGAARTLLPGPGQESAQAWYDAERASLIAVTSAAARYGHHDLAWRLPVAMRGLLELRGHTQDWITVHQIGLESARAISDREAEGWILNGLGIAYWRRRAHDDAIGCFSAALTIRAELGDDRGVAVVRTNLGSVYAAAGRPDEAAGCLRSALAGSEKLGDDFDKSFALTSLGHLEHEAGRPAQALPPLEEALRLRRRRRDRNGEAATLHCVGDTLAGLGRGTDALACLRQALLIFRQLGNRYGEAAALHSIGSACRSMGRPDHARRYLRHAVSLYRELGHSAEEETATRDLAAAGAVPGR